MNTLNNAFLALVKTINDDALKVFDSALTYILRFLSIDQQEDISWNYTEEDNRAFAEPVIPVRLAALREAKRDLEWIYKNTLSIKNHNL